MEGNESFEGNPATRLYIHTCALGNCLINMYTYMYLKVSISDDGPAKCPKNGLYTVHVHVASKCVTACTHTCVLCMVQGLHNLCSWRQLHLRPSTQQRRSCWSRNEFETRARRVRGSCLCLKYMYMYIQQSRTTTTSHDFKTFTGSQ